MRREGAAARLRAPFQEAAQPPRPRRRAGVLFVLPPAGVSCQDEEACVPLRARAALATRGRSGLGRLHQTPGGRVRRRSCVEGKAQKRVRGAAVDRSGTRSTLCLPPVAAGWQVLREKGPGQITFWFIALLIGIAAGLCRAVLPQGGSRRCSSGFTASRTSGRSTVFAESLPWVMILLIPVAGGLVVGLILHWFTPDGRVRSVADVIGRGPRSTTGGWRRGRGLPRPSPR